MAAVSAGLVGDAGGNAGAGGAAYRCGDRARRRDRAGQRRLCRAQPARGRATGRRRRRAAHRHAGRAGQRHARDHQGHAGLAGAGARLCRAGGRAGGQRGNLHPVCVRARRDGAGHQPGRGIAGFAVQRHSAGGRRRQAGRRRRQAGAARCRVDQGDQRFRRLHPRPGDPARPQRRLGGAGGARGGQPAATTPPWKNTSSTWSPTTCRTCWRKPTDTARSCRASR